MQPKGFQNRIPGATIRLIGETTQVFENQEVGWHADYTVYAPDRDSDQCRTEHEPPRVRWDGGDATALAAATRAEILNSAGQVVLDGAISARGRSALGPVFSIGSGSTTY